ncbi:MAG: hypothetical protein LBO09_07140 [Candidatus Peribacteria bacterium]|jgi:hypothetical protein|nr:hypothetical protein [Candidatus Peribacteria bacterium]
MANLSLLFDSTMGPEYPWVNTVEGNIRLDFDPHETNFTIPQDKIAGDITISAGAYQDSTLSTTNGAIDINPFASAESNTVKPFTLALNGNEITSIISPTKTLVEGTDYTFDGTTFAFTDLFLAGLSLGANIITFNMTHGIAPIYEIIVTNSDNGQGALQFTLNSDILLVKTAFNDSTNIIQQFLMPRVLPTANGPFDMQGVKQVANTNIGMNTD